MTPGATPRNAEEYLEALPPSFRAALRRLRQTIRSAAPGALESIRYGVPAFHQDGPLVHYAAFKDHCSFYIGSAKVRQKFAQQLKPFAAGKGSFRFTPEHPIPDRLVTLIVRERVGENVGEPTLRHRPKSPPKRPRVR